MITGDAKRKEIFLVAFCKFHTPKKNEAIKNKNNFKMQNLKTIVTALFIITFIFSCEKDEIINNNQAIEEIKRLETDLGIKLEINQGLNAENSIVFETLDDLKEFINKTQIRSKEDKVPFNLSSAKSLKLLASKSPCNTLTGFYLPATDFGLANLNFSIRIVDGQVDEFNPYLSGWVLGAGYTDAGHFQASTDSDIWIIAHGTEDYSLFWNGVGTLFSDNVIYAIKIPCGGAGTTVYKY